MSLWSRIANVFGGDRLSREIDEELESHLAEAIAARPRSGGSAPRVRLAAAPARRKPRYPPHRLARFASRRRRLRLAAAQEEQGDLRGRDPFARSGHRRLHLGLPAHRRPAAAALAGGRSRSGCTISRAMEPFSTASPPAFDGWAYPAFRLMRAAVKGQAELIAVSYAERVDLTYGSDQEMEKAYLQYVSGWMFGTFGLRPALGRLFTENDDLKPGAHPYAVISYDYWTRRFGAGPAR